MKKTAIYPGTFDPITYGHIDVIHKSLKIVDKVIVAISDGNQKSYLFTIEERIEIVNKALFSDLKFNRNKIKVISFNSLTTQLCKKHNQGFSNIFLLQQSVDFPNSWSDYEERLIFYHEMGVNRLSFGIQDFDPGVQEEINRPQPPELVDKLLTPKVRELFPVINFDLLIGLPGQTPKSINKTNQAMAP